MSLPPRREPFNAAPPETEGVRRLATLQRSRVVRDRSAELRERAERVVSASGWVLGDLVQSHARRYDPDGRRILTVCSFCGKARNTANVWAVVPEPFRPRNAVESHTVCLECWEREYAPLMGGMPYPGS